MPLHLLGKKSWNVYNQNSIARVRRDEAEAELRDRENQRRVEEADAESRLQILRGVRDDTYPGDQPAEVEAQPATKKRKLDEYDSGGQDARSKGPERKNHVPLMDESGHINLFPEPGSRKASTGNFELAAETKKKQQDFEDQYTMRLSNAAGRHADVGGPWYNEVARTESSSTAVPRNVWGKEDPRRADRDRKRSDANDPLAMIKKGVKQLREAEKHRDEWRAQRERDLTEVERLAQKRRHRRKRRHADEDSLDGFQLDGDTKKNQEKPDRLKERASDQRHRRHHRVESRAHRHKGPK